MIAALRALFFVVLASMIFVTSWASMHCPLFAVPRSVASHPWFIATLFDAYWGFTTFFVWVCYRQTSWIARTAWFVAIMALGNIAMATYCLAALSQATGASKAADLLTARRPGPGWLGIVMAVAGVAVTLAAAWAPHR
jgi:hypothetical protein